MVQDLNLFHYSALKISRHAGENFADRLASELEDDDGDLDVPRSTDAAADADLCLEIEHQLGSTLDEVGRQIWRGSLIMADYFIQVGSISNAQSIEVCWSPSIIKAPRCL